MVTVDKPKNKSAQDTEEHQEESKELKKSQIYNIQNSMDSKSDDTDISRRRFLKAAGLGAASLGMVALGSSLEIESDYPFRYSNKSSSTPDFEIDPDGDLDLKGNDINNVGTLNTGQLSSTGEPWFSASAYDGVGSARIQTALDAAAAADGHATVYVSSQGPDDLSGYTNTARPSGWLLQSAPEIKDDTTLIIDDAYLFLDAEVNDNLLRNADLANGNSNIHIIGRGEAVLDGNNTEQADTVFTDGIGLRLSRISTLRVRGLKIMNTRRWASVLTRCNDVRTINMRYDFTTTGGANHDGLKIHGGENIYVNGISGNTGDDMISLSNYEIAGLGDADLKNVVTENIAMDSGIHFKVVLGYDQSNNIMRNVTVRDLDLISGHAVRFNTTYAPNPPEKGDATNFTFENIHLETGSAGNAVFNSLSGADNVSISNVHMLVKHNGTQFLKVGSNFAMDSISVDNVTIDFDGGAMRSLFVGGGAGVELRASKIGAEPSDGGEPQYIFEPDGADLFTGRISNSSPGGWAAVSDNGRQAVEFVNIDSRNNTFKNDGQTAASDGGTIGHGLAYTPSIENCNVDTASSNRAYVTATNGTNLTIALENPSGAAVTADETIYWSVKARTA